jgi:transposase-like protein
MSTLFLEWGGSMGNPKRYSKEFQERAVRRMKLGENVSQLSRDLGVHRTCLYSWKRKLGRQPYGRVRGLEADWRDRRIEELEAKVTRLEGIVGGQWQELDFFESALRRIDADAAMSGTGESASTPRSVPGCDRKAN